MASEETLVTILITAHNYGRYLEQCVLSALEQDFPSSQMEVLVVDDGSTDDTPQVLASFGSRIRVLRQPQRGQVAASQAGIQLARGQFISFLDADDYYYPRRLSAVLDALGRDPLCGAAYTRFDLVDETGLLLRPNQPPRIRQGDLHDLTRYGQLVGAPSSGLTISAGLLRAHPIPLEKWQDGFDFFYLLLLPVITRIFFLPQPLFAYRQHAGSQFSSRSPSERFAWSVEHHRQVWAYARRELGVFYFTELRQEADPLDAHGIAQKLDFARRQAAFLLHDRAPLRLRIWELIKLALRLLLPAAWYRRLQRLRASLVNPL